MKISRHAKQRMKERCGSTKKSCERTANKALTEGIPHNKTKGMLNKWITSVYMKNQQANNIRIYGDKAYLFSNEFLITVLQIPSDLTKNLKRMIKE